MFPCAYPQLSRSIIMVRVLLVINAVNCDDFSLLSHCFSCPVVSSVTAVLMLQ